MSTVPALNAFIRRHFVHFISLTALLAFLFPGVSQGMRKI